MRGDLFNSALTTKNLALVCCFAPLCTVLSFWSLFPVVGPVGEFIKVTTIVAPLIGIILGPYLGTFAVGLGGVVGASLAQAGPFGPISFIPWAASALFSGLLYNRRWRFCSVLYGILLLASTFYPTVGPAWMYPCFVWFQLVGMVVLASPLQSKAVESLSKSSGSEKIVFGVGVTCFTAALFGQVVGSLMYESLYQPTLVSDLNFWKGSLQFLTFVYPIERVIITLAATVLGAPLIRTLQTFGFDLGGT